MNESAMILSAFENRLSLTHQCLCAMGSSEDFNLRYTNEGLICSAAVLFDTDAIISQTTERRTLKSLLEVRS